MKYTIISDIHSNYEALNTFFTYYDKSTELVCLGDIIGYGASPIGCLGDIRREADYVISGNHERMLTNPRRRASASYYARAAIEWTEKQLPETHSSYIARIKEQKMIENKYLLIHGSPADPDEYIFSQREALKHLKALKNKGIIAAFVGHTHQPGIFTLEDNKLYTTEKTIPLNKGGTYIINPGSIGQPRDGDTRGSYCIFDSEALTIDFYRFEYDIERAAEHIKRQNLPNELAERLFFGM